LSGHFKISAAAISARFIGKSIISGTELAKGSFDDFGWLKFGLRVEMETV
jgi:hypothetical protein